MANSVSVYSDTIKAKIRRLKWVWSVDGTSLEDETGATGFKCSMVNGTAFFVADGIDLSGYVGDFIRLVDSAGKVAYGYISAAGGGETLGAEALANATFDASIAGWTPSNCTVASIAGGQSNNCCEMTQTGGTCQHIFQSRTVISGGFYKASQYVKSGTSGNETSQFLVYTGTTFIINASTTTSAFWVQASQYATTTGVSAIFYAKKASATAGTMLFDEVSLKQVTDCAATGVHIVSTPNGATRNWASITSGFNPNDASMTFDIYDTAVSGGSVPSPVTGQIIGIKAEPDTINTPPDDYDITIVEATNGMDVLNSDAVDLPQSATSVENIRVPLDNLNSRLIYLTNETLSFSGDILALGSPASGVFYLYIREP